MGLDAHVMPISAFVVGDYESAMALMLKAAGMTGVHAVRVGPGWSEEITPPRTAWGRFQRFTGIWALRRRVKRWKASRQRGAGLQYVAWLRKAVGDAVGCELEWSEEGGSVLTRQLTFSALHALRAFALRTEFPQALGKVAAQSDDSGGKRDLTSAILERAGELGLQSERFTHLWDHSDIGGYYLPVPFDPPQWIEDPTREDEEVEALRKVSVGSSVRLQEELAELNETLGIRQRWDTGQLGLGPSETQDPDLQDVHHGWKLLDGFSRISVERRLPICFDG